MKILTNKINLQPFQHYHFTKQIIYYSKTTSFRVNVFIFIKNSVHYNASTAILLKVYDANFTQHTWVQKSLTDWLGSANINPVSTWSFNTHSIPNATWFPSSWRGALSNMVPKYVITLEKPPYMLTDGRFKCMHIIIPSSSETNLRIIKHV